MAPETTGGSPIATRVDITAPAGGGPPTTIAFVGSVVRH
jgi:hypothetical protein